MSNKNLFITPEKVTTLEELYSFYNLKNTDYKYLELNVENFNELNSYDKIILFNTKIENLDLLKLLDIEIVFIYYKLDTIILNKLKEFKNYKILIMDLLDEIFLKNSEIENYHLINPIKDSQVGEEKIATAKEKEMHLLNCYSPLDSISLEDIEFLINYNKKDYNIVYKGLKKIYNRKQFDKFKKIINNNIITISFPILKLEQNIVDSNSLISLGEYYPIDVLYFLNYKKDGELVYKNSNNLNWLDEKRDFYFNKKSLKEMLDKTIKIEEVI